jgi:hypothetical protein
MPKFQPRPGNLSARVGVREVEYGTAMSGDDEFEALRAYAEPVLMEGRRLLLAQAIGGDIEAQNRLRGNEYRLTRWERDGKQIV